MAVAAEASARVVRRAFIGLKRFLIMRLTLSCQMAIETQSHLVET
jgi:hypothetical protein